LLSSSGRRLGGAAGRLLGRCGCLTYSVAKADADDELIVIIRLGAE
jgi:hypothetical protein